MGAEWSRPLTKFSTAAPPAVLRASASNMTRYCAFLAYERREFREGLKLLSLISPASFLRDVRNLKMAVACTAGLLLPGAIHHLLEQMAGIPIRE